MSARSRHLVLVGLPGAGKTSAGRYLARKLGRPFADSDQLIEQRLGLSVSTIFERYGEPHFRAVERRICAELLAGSGRVIALGGGAFCQASTRALVARRALSLWLDPPFDIIVARLRDARHRPLFVRRDCEKLLRELVRTRGAALKEADLRIRTTDLGELAQAVIGALSALDEEVA